MTGTPLVPHDVAARQFADTFRLFVGKGRRFSASAIADATGIKLRTIESYQSGQATPGLANYQALMLALGPAFATATIQHLALSVQSTDPGDLSPQEILTDVCGFTAQLAQFLEDGRIDHTERPQLLISLNALIERMSGLALNLRHEGGQ